MISLQNIIDKANDECMNPIFEGLRNRIEEYFWNTVRVIQENHENLPILKDEIKIQTIIGNILRKFDRLQLQDLQILQDDFHSAYEALEIVVSKILRKEYCGQLLIASRVQSEGDATL